MLIQLFFQLAVATMGPLGPAATHLETLVPLESEAPRVVAGPKDQTALDILNNTRPDLLRRGAALGCPVVTRVYVDGKLRQAPTVQRGFSTATVYVVGDTVMVMLPPSVADALRTVPAADVHDIQYVDCSGPDSLNAVKNTLYITTK